MFAIGSEIGPQHALPMKNWHISTVVEIW